MSKNKIWFFICKVIALEVLTMLYSHTFVWSCQHDSTASLISIDISPLSTSIFALIRKYWNALQLGQKRLVVKVFDLYKTSMAKKIRKIGKYELASNIFPVTHFSSTSLFERKQIYNLTLLICFPGADKKKWNLWL